jgi:putative heme-binding domain-containing protein
VQALGENVLPALAGRAERLSPIARRELQRIFAESEAARAGALFAKVEPALGPEDYLRFAQERKGDPARGRELFHDPRGAGCHRCHAVQGRGGAVGPDLSQAGEQFSRDQLAESVLFPSRAVREGYQQWVVVTRRGEAIVGLLKAEDADSLTLHDSQGALRRVRKAELVQRNQSQLSLMPEGFERALSPEDFADLIAYLASLTRRAGEAAK